MAQPAVGDSGLQSAAGGSRRVLMIASEAVPFAKTGGLADVLGALPPALARLGWAVSVVLPRYRDITGGSLVDLFPLTVGGVTREVGISEIPTGASTRALFVDCPELYDRDGIYGAGGADFPDNATRFATLV